MTILRRLLARRTDWPPLAEAVVWLGLAWLALRWMPFRRLVLLLRPPLPARRTPADEREISRVVWAVEAAARRVPWRAVCFHEGIAVQRMLSRRAIGADLHYGVVRGADGALPAHVWVTVGGRVVVGGEESLGHTVLATFSPVVTGR